MGRHKKIDYEYLTYDEIFGGNTTRRKTIISSITDGRAVKCSCGHLPRIHDVAFNNPVAHPKHFYVDCSDCCECDGEWYGTEEEAIKAWNNLQSKYVEVRVSNN